MRLAIRWAISCQNWTPQQYRQRKPLRIYARNTLKSSERGAAIIQDLLALARRGVSISEVINRNRIITDYFESTEFERLKAYHHHVSFHTDLDQNLLNLKGSPVHLGKTLMNLVTNAVEALSTEGEVTIQTGNCYLNRSIQGYNRRREGEYVIMRVSDNGKGISKEDIGKIFEPFYTKKIMGKSGTGLGLAVVWGTVKDHNGYIDVHSEEGKGSTFTLYFPVTKEELKNTAEEAVSLEAFTGNGESILVVDDLIDQQVLARNILERIGYQVTAVSSGEEAIEFLNREKADLVVLDMIMNPGIDGLETYQRILEINPEQKAIIISGYSEMDRIAKARELGAGQYIRKPYTMETLGLAIRRELEGK